MSTAWALRRYEDFAIYIRHHYVWALSRYHLPDFVIYIRHHYVSVSTFAINVSVSLCWCLTLGKDKTRCKNKRTRTSQLIHRRQQEQYGQHEETIHLYKQGHSQIPAKVLVTSRILLEQVLEFLWYTRGWWLVTSLYLVRPLHLCCCCCCHCYNINYCYST